MKRPAMRFKALLFALICLLLGCNSIFTDLSGDVPTSDGAMPVDGGSLDAGDGGSSGADVVASGSFSGRTGYRASGGVQLQRRAGQLELVFSSEFMSQAVPGPVIVLSTRDSLGNRLDEALGDIELGELSENSGAQTYPLPAAAESARYVWVYCLPFRVEVARAPLEVPEAP